MEGGIQGHVTELELWSGLQGSGLFISTVLFIEFVIANVAF
jgi:hypothetical protein